MSIFKRGYMFVVNILALLLIILALSVKFKKSLIESLPVAVSLMILTLFILAFFRGLFLIDYLSIFIIFFSAVFWIRLPKDKQKILSEDIISKLKAPSFWVFTVLMILITLGVSDKLITWWDDYNFWGTDVKAIYYSDGFASKYHNVQPEFGDYPPATQLVKWFFLHMKPDEFDEGLMFAGYYFMIFSFIAPVLRFFDSKKIYSSVIAGLCMIAFPATIEAFHLDGCCADMCMAVCFGYFLISLYEIKDGIPGKSEETKSDRLFGLGRCALSLSVMSLCKNTSFIWIFLALIYTLIIITKDRVKTLLYIFVPVIAVLGSWEGYCLINRRVAKMLVNSLKIVTGRMGIPDYRRELVDAFVEAYLKWPLHRYSQGIVNLSPISLILILVAGFVLLGILGRITKRDTIVFSLFTVITCLTITAITFGSHLTLFATEDQYLEPFAMVSSIERYGAPFGIGILMLIINVIFLTAASSSGNNSWKKYCPYAIVALFILLTTDYVSLYRGYYGYRENTANVLAERESLISKDIISLNEQFDTDAKEDLGRVMYVRDFSDLSWISHAYIAFDVAPLSVVFDYTDDLSVPIREAQMRSEGGPGVISQNAENGYDALLRKANEYHADYIYLDKKLYPVK